MNTVEGLDRISLITKRDLERKLNVQKQKDFKELSSAKNEKIDFFNKDFLEKRLEIEDAIALSESLPRKDLPNHFNDISKQILTLQRYVAASNLFLRTYDIKIYNQNTQELTVKIKELEEKLLPKKKFGFKNKKITTNELIQTRDEPDYTRKFIINADENSTGFSNKQNEQLVLRDAEIFKKGVILHDLDNCTIKILGSPSTLHMNRLKNCLILSGPVSTSIFADNCDNCTLVIACQQLRLHSSKNTKIYLHVTSRAIMEDCSKISVAPYNLQYVGMEKDFEDSGLDRFINNWQSVDDFNWLHVAQHSPNWQIIEENERMCNWSL